MIRFPVLATLSVAALSACANPPVAPDPAAPPIRPSLSQANESSLTFAENAPGAPSIATMAVSFYAVKGQDRRVSLYYHAWPGSHDSTEFLQFRVTPKSLLTQPNGTPFANGDSILISLTVVDSTRLIVDFQPNGLRFDPKNPARLTYKWGETDEDLDHDGVVGPSDDIIRLGSAIWGQEQPGLPWSSLATSFDLVAKEADAKVSGFTRYAWAY